MGDIYDNEIDFLVKHPHKIEKHWDVPTPLFEVLGTIPMIDDGNTGYGCVTEVKTGFRNSQDDGLTLFLQQDDRVIDSGQVEHICECSQKEIRECLNVFADYQRLANTLFKRTDTGGCVQCHSFLILESDFRNRNDYNDFEKTRRCQQCQDHYYS